MREFGLVIAAGLLSAFLGGLFGALVGWVSPEFIALMTQPVIVAQPVRFGAATGLVAGLFIGAAAMGFGLIVSTIRAWVKRPTLVMPERESSASSPPPAVADDKYYAAR